MLQPAEIDLASYIGADYYDTWEFWANLAQTQPYDFSGWSGWELKVGTQVLTVGNGGLTIAATAGQVSPFIARTVTAGLRPGVQRYTLFAVDTSNHGGFLMLGGFSWEDPES